MDRSAIAPGESLVAEDKIATAEQFGDWVAPHWASMARLASRLSGPNEWEEVLQEALACAWRKRSRYDPDAGSPRNWLLALTSDQARKAARRGRRHQNLALGEIPMTEPTADRDMDIEKALGRLSARQRLAITLHYFLDLPIADSAVVMDCSQGTVKSTLSDARARLRRELGKDYANDQRD